MEIFRYKLPNNEKKYAYFFTSKNTGKYLGTNYQIMKNVFFKVNLFGNFEVFVLPDNEKMHILFFYK